MPRADFSRRSGKRYTWFWPKPHVASGKTSGENCRKFTLFPADFQYLLCRTTPHFDIILTSPSSGADQKIPMKSALFASFAPESLSAPRVALLSTRRPFDALRPFFHFACEKNLTKCTLAKTPKLHTLFHHELHELHELFFSILQFVKFVKFVQFVVEINP